MSYPKHLLTLIQLLRRLPGVGSKSAERLAFRLVDWTPSELGQLAEALVAIPESLKICPQCGCLQGEKESCLFCPPSPRDSQTLCIVAHFKDVFSIEETRLFRGRYHVLGALLSPIDGKGPDAINIPKIQARIEKEGVRELIIAIDSTLEGDATSLYIKQELQSPHLQITRLAFGLPMGSSLDYVDGGTLARALSGRNQY